MMASETVNSVLAAEKENDRKLTEAKEQAAKIIADANMKAQSVLDDAVAEAKAKAARITAEAQKKADEIADHPPGDESSSGNHDGQLFAAAVKAVKERALR